MKTYKITGSLGTWTCDADGNYLGHDDDDTVKYEEVNITVKCRPHEIKQIVRLMNAYDGGVEYKEVKKCSR